MTERKPVNKAAALLYDGNGAPRIAANGRDAMAEKIVAIAQEHWRPIFENEMLADLLCQMEIDQEIPENLFKTVAHIIAFAHEIEQSFAIVKETS